MFNCFCFAELNIFADEETPEFEESIPNITVPVGRDAQMPCKMNCSTKSAKETKKAK